MFEKKRDKLFGDMSNVCGIADEILIVGFDKQGEDHDETLDKVLQFWRYPNVSLTKINVSLGVPAFTSLVR